MFNGLWEFEYDKTGECIRCEDKSDGIVFYEFDTDGLKWKEEYEYCQECAKIMDERFNIDGVVGGDIEL